MPVQILEQFIVIALLSPSRFFRALSDGNICNSNTLSVLTFSSVSQGWVPNDKNNDCRRQQQGRPRSAGESRRRRHRHPHRPPLGLLLRLPSCHGIEERMFYLFAIVKQRDWLNGARISIRSLASQIDIAASCKTLPQAKVERRR